MLKTNLDIVEKLDLVKIIYNQDISEKKIILFFNNQNIILIL